MQLLLLPAASVPLTIQTPTTHRSPLPPLLPTTWHWQVKNVGLFGKANLLPSGGVTPEKAKEWFEVRYPHNPASGGGAPCVLDGLDAPRLLLSHLQAGAFAVGMGSRLVGKDVRVLPTDSAALQAAKVNWRTDGRDRAAALFKSLGSLPSKL